MQPKRKTLIGISMVIALTILFHYIGWLSPIENFIRQIINPISAIVYEMGVTINGQEEKFKSGEDLLVAYSKLKTDYLAEKVDQTQLSILLAENAELRQRVNFLQKNNYQHLGAEVIGKNIDPLGSAILIDRGEKDGVKVGNPVIVSDGVLVGVVAKVEIDSAVVRLINDNQSKIGAGITNSDKSVGLIEGGFAISVQMNLIPQNEEIKPGETVFTSGLNKNIPRGLIIGTVEAVEKEAYQPFQRAIISPIVKLDKLTSVSVLIIQ